jgi:hypothetical protein
MSAATKLTREEIFSLIPTDAKRVKVTDEMGALRWRDIENGLDAILDGDEIMLLRGDPITMKNKPGRRKKAAAAPGMGAPAPVSHVAAQVKAAKSAHIKRDSLFKSVSQSVDSEDVLHYAMMAFAEESASLGFERTEAERKGSETSQLSIRRIGAIKALVDSWLKRKDQLAGKMIDLDSPAFASLFAFMVETFREAMLKGGVPPDQAETIFVALSERMADDTWEQEARNRMKGA